MGLKERMGSQHWTPETWEQAPVKKSSPGYWVQLCDKPEEWDGSPPSWDESSPPALLVRYVRAGVKQTDAVPSFHEWCFWAAVSGYVGRFWAVDLGAIDVYPNLYIVLVGPSSKARKTTCIKMAQELIRRLSISRIPEDGTPEAFYDKFVEHPTALMVASEFSGILATAAKKYGAGIVEFLMNVYDCPDEISRTLRSGDIVVKEPYLTILGGATMTMLRNRLTTAASLGGFTPRFAMVFYYTHPLSGSAPRMISSSLYDEIAAEIVAKIPAQEIGRLKTSDEARLGMGAVGSAFNAFLSDKIGNLGDALAARALPRVLKVATLCALIQGRDEMLFEDLNYAFGLEARRFLEVERLREVLATTLTGPEATIRIGNLIEDAGTLTRTELCRFTYPNVSVKRLDSCLASLTEQEKIVMTVESSGGRPRHRYTWVFGEEDNA